MTILDERPANRPATRPATRRRDRSVGRAHGPRPTRPPVGLVRYRGSGVAASTAYHGCRRRDGRRVGGPVSTTMTLALAGLTALITLWLGSLAKFGSANAEVPSQLPERLAVVVVHPGEGLHQLAGRIAPDAPAAAVVERIRELNELDSVSVDAGQTLIAPVG